jgi:hypothetical protein
MAEIVKYSIKGTIVDSNDKPILGALIENSIGDKTRSQFKGIFTLKGRYNENNQFNLTISKKGYNTISNIIPFNQDNSIKTDPGVYRLSLVKNNIEDEISGLNDYSKEQLDLLKQQKPKDFISILSQKLINSVKLLLIPAIVKLISEFGVTNLNKLLDKNNINFNDLKASCPSNIENLNKLINVKNKFTKQLNILLGGINTISKFLNLPPKIISTAETSIPPLKIGINVASFIPSTAVTPIPVGPILIAKDAIKALEDIIKVLNPKLGQNTFQLNFLRGDLNKVIKLFSILDTLIQGCAEEIGGTLGEQEQISKELLESTQQQSQQLSPVVTNINGFEMNVVNVDNVTIGGLKRRKAVARNKAGVIMLQGEPSFSSNDQILIDELVFYIQQNDLKAD